MHKGWIVAAAAKFPKGFFFFEDRSIHTHIRCNLCLAPLLLKNRLTWAIEHLIICQHGSNFSNFHMNQSLLSSYWCMRLEKKNHYFSRYSFLLVTSVPQSLRTESAQLTRSLRSYIYRRHPEHIPFLTDGSSQDHGQTINHPKVSYHSSLRPAE